MKLSMHEVLTRRARPDKPRYDIFLSQAFKDEELVLGIHTILTEDLGLTVFCDWIEAGHSDHAGTTPADAAYIRDKMLASTGLVFIDSEHAAGSNWMSWELGWFHGAKGRICVLPIVKDGSEHYRVGNILVCIRWQRRMPNTSSASPCRSPRPRQATLRESRSVWQHRCR
jgi:hypothetical protein